MTLLDHFHAVLAASAVDLPGPELLPERLAHACAEVLPVDGAGIGLYFSSRHRVPLGASDPDSAEAERLQFTVGRGPCLSAHARQEPVLADEATLRAQWPNYHAALVTRTPIRGVVSLPLRGALHGIGALDLYVTPPNTIRALSIRDATLIGAEITRYLQDPDQQLRDQSDGPAWLDAPAALGRSQVWQAIGVLNAALRLGSPDALAVLRARAYADGTTLDELAERVLDRRLPVDELALDADTGQ